MSRDWLKAFRPASFRGVGFQVDGEELAGARRLSMSPIAYSDQTVMEDMGGEPRRFDLTAYVAGDAADAAALALIAALQPKGPGLLMLPMIGAVRARVRSWRLSRQKSVAGYVAFDISALEEGLSSVPFGPVAGAGPISSMLLAGASILGAALAETFPAAGRETTETRAAGEAASRLASVSTDVTAGQALDDDLSAAIEALAGAASSASAVGVAGALVAGWNVLALEADPDTAFTPVSEALSSVDFGSGTGIAEGAALAGALAIVAVRGTYAAQQDAARARKALAEAVAPALTASGGLGDAAFGWLSSMTGEAALALSRVAASRVPLVRVETPLSLSAIRAAFDLYGDAKRAGELVGRNHVSTPVFMPVSFEALAT